jgi:ech hydrogenase subunit D
MSIISEQIIEPITAETLLEKVREKRQQNWRLVQIGATRLPDQFQLTYSFDLESRLVSLRLHIPGTEPRVPSISSIYGCAILYENELHDLFGITADGLTVDFHGNFYQTAVKFPLGTAKLPVPKPAAPAKTQAPTPAPAPAAPATT